MSYKISPTCEYMIDFGTHTMCDAPTAFWYPALGGTMALCAEHGARHFPKAAQRVGDETWHGGGEPKEPTNV